MDPLFSPEGASTAIGALALIGVAELGDKSQLACMVLASRYRPVPVLLGAALAFLLLNTLAVTLGAGLAVWVPERWLTTIVALLFLGFALQTWRSAGGISDDAVPERSGRFVAITTFSMIFLAELGDKTQIAVAGLASTSAPLPVWVGATTALLLVSALGVWAGRTLLQRVPVRTVQRAGALLFLLFGVVAGWRAINMG